MIKAYISIDGRTSNETCFDTRADIKMAFEQFIDSIEKSGGPDMEFHCRTVHDHAGMSVFDEIPEVAPGDTETEDPYEKLTPIK